MSGKRAREVRRMKATDRNWRISRALHRAFVLRKRGKLPKGIFGPPFPFLDHLAKLPVSGRTITFPLS